MINSHCYDFKLLRNNNKGILDDFVDATYILTLVGSERQKHIDEQLKLYTPTKKIYIVYNQGYEKCDKVLTEQIPPYDITDSYLNAINHSLMNNYNNILILEDDFIFSPLIKDESIVKYIHTFFIKNKDKTFYYNLGTAPALFYPNINIFNNTFRGIFCPLSHAVIYTKKIQLDIIKRTNENIKSSNNQWDNFLTNTYLNYFYKYPLCYQTFPKTKNKEYWCDKSKYSYYCTIEDFIISNFYKIVGLDKRPQPGFNIMYTIFFIFNYSIFLLFILFLLFIFLKIFNKKNILNVKKYLLK